MSGGKSSQVIFKTRRLGWKYSINEYKWNHLEVGHPDNPKTYRVCGAQKVSGDGLCMNNAGKGTKHIGRGRCFRHGGASSLRLELLKTGKRAWALQNHLRQAYIDQSNQEEINNDPLNLMAELAVQRDLLYIFLARQGKMHGIPLPEVPLTEAGQSILEEAPDMDKIEMPEFIKLVFGMIADITRITNAVSSQRKDAVMSMTEIHRQAARLQSAVELTFEEYIDDPEIREKAVQRFIARSGSLLPSG